MNDLLSNTFNAIGITLSIIGAFIMYKNTPKVSSQLVAGLFNEAEQMQKRDAYKNEMIRKGMLLLFIGFIFQLIPLIIFFISVLFKNEKS